MKEKIQKQHPIKVYVVTVSLYKVWIVALKYKRIKTGIEISSKVFDYS